MPSLDEFEDKQPPRVPHVEWAKAEVVVGPDGGTLSTGVLTGPIELTQDWDGVLVGFGLDPAVFEIVDDTVRMSKWQQSARSKAGDRDMVWLYSYSAKFIRRLPQLSEIDILTLRKNVQKWKPAATKPAVHGTPCTYLVNLADLQIGKSQGGGIDGAIRRIESALESSVQHLAYLRLSHNIQQVAIANMGDPIEGCEGNYASQLFTVQASLREQLNLALDVLMKAIEVHSADTFISVLSNHSEWMRRGGKQVTGDSDSADGYLADTLKRIYEKTDKGPTNWVIPHDEMVVMANLSGVNVAFTHGHKIPSESKEHTWLQGHSIKLLRDYGAEPRIWVTAHKHHYYQRDFGPWTRFQCPSLDGGSKWFTDLTGMWATPGMLTMLIGNHDPRGYSDVCIL